MTKGTTRDCDTMGMLIAQSIRTSGYPYARSDAQLRKLAAQARAVLRDRAFIRKLHDRRTAEQVIHDDLLRILLPRRPSRER